MSWAGAGGGSRGLVNAVVLQCDGVLLTGFAVYTKTAQNSRSLYHKLNRDTASHQISCGLCQLLAPCTVLTSDLGCVHLLYHKKSVEDDFAAWDLCSSRIGLRRRAGTPLC